MPQVPGVEGVTVIWPALQATERAANFRNPGGASRWHTDLVHERQPAGITHLHNDVVPPVGGDTLWASGYAAYEKLSPGFRKIIDGKKAIFKSAHTYLDRDDPNAGPKHIERVHPIVRIHPATGWKSLFVNRAFTTKIVGLDKAESDVLLNYLFDVYERVSRGVWEQSWWHWRADPSSRTSTSSSASSGRREQVLFGTIVSLSTMHLGTMKVAILDMALE